MNKAFTLIELLIVVAIIAILAAIAVPNFLEAQTRSKVSRVKADMASIATAMEAYMVDSNYYPYPQIFNLENYPMSLQNWGFLAINLTTPISYLTSLPIDRFNIFYKGGNGQIINVQENHPWTRYRSWIRKMLPPWSGTNDSNTNATAIAYYTGYWKIAAEKLNFPAESTGYLLTSPGPDKLEETIPAYAPNTYDPTNGTVSKGDITRIGGGGGYK